MTSTPTQSADSHTRWNPLFHFIAAPVTAAYAIYRIKIAVTTPTTDAWSEAIFAFGVACAVFVSRTMALSVQDRLIRLEERLRMERVLPAGMHGMISGLDRRQLVAIRFAPDEELADLMPRIISGELREPKAIKRAIGAWRADWHRA